MIESQIDTATRDAKSDAGGRRDVRSPREQLTRGQYIRKLACLSCCVLILVFGSMGMLLVSCLTLFRTRRFCAEVLAKRMSRLALWCFGVRIVEHRDFAYAKHQTVYVSNHTSSLDVLVLIALGLPRTRYFLSGFLRAILPLGLVAYLIGTFWTKPQRYPAARTRIFQRAERVLRTTGDSVFLTPEGQQIGCFNKGAFHLATNLVAPIQPIYIRIPTIVDPGPWSHNTDLDVRPGTVDVYYRPPIDTRAWRLDDLEENRDSVRDMYFEWERELGDSTYQELASRCLIPHA